MMTAYPYKLDATFVEAARALASALPTARLLLLPGAGHLEGFRDQRDAYTRALLEHCGA